jgi:hypothetical protein
MRQLSSTLDEFLGPLMAKTSTIRILGAVLVLGCALSPALAARKLAAPAPLKGVTDAGKMALSWTNVSGETGFLVERRLYDGGSFAEITKTTADVTVYTDIVTTTESYEYRVRAYRTQGGVVYSDYTNTVVSTAPCP